MKWNVNPKSPFHESYFTHHCAVGTERDVLATDIKGNSWCHKLRRWWSDLFLLSYSNEQCRVFFVSSQALRLERRDHFRNYRDRIHPLSKFSEAWAVFILAVFVLNRFTLNHNTALLFGTSAQFCVIMGILTELIMLFDLYINFKTGHADLASRKIVLGCWEKFLHFSSTKLFLHVAAVVPFNTIMALRYGFSICPICRATPFTCYIKLLSIFGYYKVYDASKILGTERRCFRSMQCCRFLRIFILAMITMLHLLIVYDAVNILLIQKTGEVPQNSYFAMVLQVRNILNDIPDVFVLCVVFSILIKSALFVGFGIFRRDYYIDQIFGLVCLGYSLFFLCWVGIEFFTVVTKCNMADDQYTKHVQRTSNWMRCEQVSEKIKDKISSYFNFKTSRNIVFKRDNQFYNCLPAAIQRDLKITLYYTLLRRIPYFSDWPVNVVEDLVMLLKEEVFSANDLIAAPFSRGEGLVILESGVIALYTASGAETGHLIDGDYFGELALITDNEVQTSAVVAVTICKTQILTKALFRKFMRKHPKLFFELRRLLMEKYEQRSSDLPSSPDRTSPRMAPTEDKKGNPRSEQQRPV